MADKGILRCTACGGLNRVDLDRSHPTCGRCFAQLDPSASPQNLTDAELTSVIAKSPVPVLVDFWATWCAPCRTMSPHLVGLAHQHRGRLIVAKVDIDVHREHAERLKVQSIPTIALYDQQKMVRQVTGARTLPELETFIRPWMTKPSA